MLAGGLGSRFGARGKASAQLAGRPLISYPLAALAAVADDVAVVCKRDTVLPPLPAGVERWEEPDVPRHPLTGIVEALRRAGGRSVLVCAVDTLVAPEAMARLLEAARERPGVAAVVAQSADGLAPTLAVYGPAALPALLQCEPGARLREVVAGLAPTVVRLAPAEAPINVNTPAALAEAAERLPELSRRSPTWFAPAGRTPGR